MTLAACVAHPVGPARTQDDYQRKASTTAASALSAVETTRLLAEAAVEGEAFGSYLSVSVSEQEDNLGGIRGTFASIQPPPDIDSARLRSELIDVLDRSIDDVGAVRIEVRRGGDTGLDELATRLADDADDLRAIVVELS